MSYELAMQEFNSSQRVLFKAASQIVKDKKRAEFFKEAVRESVGAYATLVCAVLDDYDVIRPADTMATLFISMDIERIDHFVKAAPSATFVPFEREHAALAGIYRDLIDEHDVSETAVELICSHYTQALLEDAEQLYPPIARELNLV